MNRFLVTIIIGMFAMTHSNAQIQSFIKQPFDTLTIYRVELKDGMEIVGHYVVHDSTTLVLKTKQIPKLEIPFKNIYAIEVLPVSSFRDGVYWFKNPHATRYFFAPSAFNLKKGEGYYQNAYLFFNSFNVGVTNNFSIGGGLEIISFFGSIASNNAFSPIFFITPKWSFKATDRFRYGLGMIYINVPSFFSDEGRSGAGITYAMGTLGDENKNLTFGAGLSFANEAFSSEPLFTVCGMSRISKRTAVVTENWLLANRGTLNGIYSYGFRFFGEKIAVDLGFINNADIAQALIVGIPYVDFTVKF